MTRDEAIDKACAAMPRASVHDATCLVVGLEALGLIKFDEPRRARAVLPHSIMVPVIDLAGDGMGGFKAEVHVAHLIHALTSRGFELRFNGQTVTTLEGPYE